MDMTNATQAGPTHGLLDLLFGTAPKGDANPEETPMDPIAALVKALEKQGKGEDEEKADLQWTEMDATAGRAATDPGFAPPLAGTTPNAVMPAADTASGIDPALLEAVGGNTAVAALIQKMEPRPEALRAIKAGDTEAVMRLIEERKAELRGQMPALGLLEKAIERDGLEKVVGTSSVAQLVAKFEAQHANQGKIRKGASTEDFLAVKGMKPAAVADKTAAETANAPDAELALPTALAPFGSKSGAGAAVAGAATGTGASGAASGTAVAMAASAQPSASGPDYSNYVGGSDPANEGATAAAKPRPPGAKGAPTAEVSQPQEMASLKEAAGAKSAAEAKQGADAKHAVDAKVGESVATGAGGTAIAAGITEPAPPQGYFQTLETGDMSRDGMRDTMVPRMAHNISYIAKRGGGQLTMTIHPKELGEVQLKVSTNGRDVEIKIVAQNADVANALRSGAGELADALSTQKLNVANIDISAKSGASGEFPSDGGQQGAFANLNERQANTQDFASARRDSDAGAHTEGREPKRDGQQQAARDQATGNRPGEIQVRRKPNGSIDLNA